MQSVLNEGDVLQSVLNFFRISNKSKSSYEKERQLKNNSVNLGGSISRYSKNLIMSFPVLCDSSIPIDTAMMVSKANERNIGDLLQLMFASININLPMSAGGATGADIISTIYKDLDPNADINDVINSLEKIAAMGEDTKFAKSEEIEAIREMLSQFKAQKEFPNDIFSEKSLNEYIVKQVYNQVIVGEASSSGNSDYNTLIGSDPKDNTAQNRIAAQRANDAEVQNNIRNNRDRVNDIDKRASDLINLNKSRLTANDIRKANEMQPMLLVINYMISNGNTKELISKESFLAGIKSRLIPVESVDIIERFAAKNRTKISLKNLIRATTGEINLVKDFLLCMDQVKADAKNAAKKGPMANIWHILEKRGAQNNRNKLKRSNNNDAAAITSIIISQESVNYMKTAYGFDIENIQNTRLIVDSFNILGLFICDESTETVKYIYDGYNEFETISYASLDREISDKNYRKIINLVNQVGR